MSIGHKPKNAALCTLLYILGTADFVPNCLAPPGFAKMPQFETFGQTMALANNWISQQQGVRITNAQSVDYKIESNWSKGYILLILLFIHLIHNVTRFHKRICLNNKGNQLIPR